MCSTVVFYGEASSTYSFPEGHPFSGRRVEGFWEEMEKRGITKQSGVKICKPVLCSEDDLLTFHTKDYVDFVKESSKLGRGMLDSADTPSFKGVFEASSYTVGSTLAGLEMVVKKSVDHAFNPVGGLHHARKNSAAGFCVFNDVAIAILKAKTYGLKRILYVDIDAHHGDGVFYEFLEDKNVKIVDVHEDWRTLYPGTGKEEERGEGAAVGTKLNIVLPAGSDDKIFYSKFEKAKDFISNINPEFIIFQCGGDSLKGDPLTHLNLTPKVHADVADFLKKLSTEKKCYGPLAVGGGGYNNITTSQAWINVINSFIKGDL
jgi:acetoin utilization protein AcuC